MYTYDGVRNLFNQIGNGTPSQKIMIVGRKVTTVQDLSRYCLLQGIEILPYYGFPTLEEVTLFSPDLLIICLPAPEDFLVQIDRPSILWSEPSYLDKSKFDVVKVASTCTELKSLLQQRQLA
jgi:hypothetical protein